MNHHGHHLPSIQLGDVDVDVDVEDQRNPSIHLSRNLGDAGEDVEDEEEVFLQVG